MSTEPERNIEKQLRAYANKRRTEAGAPFELHPVTRRLLHEEVAKRGAAASSASSSLTRIFFLLWPRYAFVIPLLMLSGLVLLYKVFDNKQPMELARNVPGSTAPSDEEIGSKTMVSRTVGEGTRGDGKIERPASAPSKSPQIQTALRNARPAVAPKTAERERTDSLDSQPPKFNLLEPTSRLAREEAAAGATDANVVRAPAAVPSVQNAYLNYDGSAIESATQRFAQVSLAKPSPASKTSTANVVLTSFQMEQVGDRIRVIDNDGSTYIGHLQKVNAPVKQQIDDGRELLNEARKAKTLASASATSKDSKSEAEADPDYYFRVVGTNRNLKQQVIFSGHLLANADSAGYSNTNLNTTAAAQLQVPAQNQSVPVLLNSRIDGTALVGGSNNVSIRAVPVAPR